MGQKRPPGQRPVLQDNVDGPEEQAVREGVEVGHKLAKQAFADPQAAGQLLLGAKDLERSLQQFRRSRVHSPRTTTAGFWIGRNAPDRPV